MPSSYSTNLKIELIPTGAQSGVWGATTNTNLGTAVEQAIVGTATCVTADFTANVATYTLIDTNALQTARAFCLNVTATLSGAGTINVPAIQKPYLVFNNSVGGFAVTVKVSGQTGVSVPNGKKAWLYNDGTDVGVAFDYAPSLALGSALLTSSGGTGQTSYTAGDMTYYASGTAFTKLPIGTIDYVLTSTGTAPQWSPPGSVVIGTATNLAGGTTGASPYQSAPGTTTFLTLGSLGQVMTAGATGPTYVNQSTLSVGFATNATNAVNATSAVTATNATNAVNATSAVTATNLAGGAANRIAYQTGAGATNFTPAPTVTNYVLSWNGTTIDWASVPSVTATGNLVGGTAGVVPYQSATDVTAFTAVGVAGQPLVSNGTGAPAFALLGISGGGTNSTATPAAGAVAYGTGTEFAFSTVGVVGQALVSNGVAAPTWQDFPQVPSFLLINAGVS